MAGKSRKAPSMGLLRQWPQPRRAPQQASRRPWLMLGSASDPGGGWIFDGSGS